jgi:next-to-BRCA1 protein 1
MATTTTQSRTLIVKMSEGDEIRRFTTNALNYANLAHRVTESFSLPAGSFATKYTDDEGDVITMSSEDELAEAVALAFKSEPSVLRIQVFKRGVKPAAQTQTNKPAACGNLPNVPAELAPLVSNIVAQLPALAQQLPEAIRRVLPNIELDLGATLDAARANFGPPAGCGVEGYHPGVTCDRTNVSPIIGNRYNLKNHDYDLQESEFLKLNAEEQALYVKIPPVCFRRTAREAPAGTNEFGGGKPFGAPEEQGFHPGVVCDKSGMAPIYGFRFHLQGHNYDLCQVEFDKLTPEEQSAFVRVAPPKRCRWGKHYGGPFGKNGLGGAKHGPHGKLAARFVSDVSIPDGMQVTPATKFTKIWRLKNIGECHWPAGTRLLFVGGDHLAAEMTVPLGSPNPIAPGEEVDVAVEMVAPAELGRFMGYWRLAAPTGRPRFGQRIWVHVQVVGENEPVMPPNEQEIISMRAAREAAAKEDGDDEPPADEAAAAAAAAVAAATAASSSSQLAESRASSATDEEAVLVDVATADDAPVADGPKGDDETAKVAAELASMGFDVSLVDVALEKHGANLEACVQDLAAVQEWDSMLDDLAEMGFGDRPLNQRLLMQHSGSLKKTVKELHRAA